MFISKLNMLIHLSEVIENNFQCLWERYIQFITKKATPIFSKFDELISTINFNLNNNKLPIAEKVVENLKIPI